MLLHLAGVEARATWYSENVESGADIMMMDLRWPWWPSGSYFANWNSGFNPKPNNVTFYAGFTSYLADGPGQLPNSDAALQDAFRPGSVWTFWGSDEAGTPVRFVDVAPNLFIRNDYGGEGSSGTTGAEVWRFMTRRQWYTMLARVWRHEGQSHAGRWIKDHADGRWHLIGYARLPIPATSFTGNSGFLEPLTSEKAVRSLHRRLGYYRKDGEWRKSDTVSIDRTQYVIVNTVAEGDHEYAAIEYAQHPANLPRELTGPILTGDAKHSFTTRQPAQPALDRPAVQNVRAVASGGHVAVSWEVPPDASPAFGCRVEVFDNERAEGEPLAVREERLPSLRDLLVKVDGRAAAVRLTVIDVFDQRAEPVVVEASTVEAAVPAAVTEPLVPGLAYELLFKDSRRPLHYFNPPSQKPDERHAWINLDEIGDGKLWRSGLARGFDASVRENRDQGFAFRFEGWLRVPESGPWIFRTQIDGAYQLEVGGRTVVVRDGQAGTTEQAEVVVLAKGDHPIRVTHVHDALPARNFRIDWEGPGVKRQAIPVEALHAADRGGYPEPVLTAEAPGDGTGAVTVSVEARGHVIDRTELFLGGLQLAASQDGALTWSGPLPAGVNELRARVIFDGNRTVDSPALTLPVSGRPVAPEWTVRNVGDRKASAGLWQTGPGQFRFFGNGMHTVTRRVTGDFTATCRLASWNGSKGEPVNGHAWTGLTAREHGERIEWNWGRDFHLVQTAAHGLRASADFTDFGAGRVSSYALPKDRPWLRIMRQGDIWTAWTSADGKAWELGAYQLRKCQAEMDCGLFFSALPQDARAHYHSIVEDFAIIPGAAPDCVVPEPAVARSTGGPRLTGVVMAPSDAMVRVVRSSHAGLLRSVDGGKTWQAANGSLSGSDLAVRSVAIHPTRPEVMLRAGGDDRTSAAWRTEDGGLTWTRMPLEADFDGAGPSALCGEVLAFDLRDPQVVYAGGESKGFFRSADGGDTWQACGAAGERITAVVVWPWERHYPAPAQGRTHLCVTTCPDRWMRLLGRGEPGTTTTAKASRGYVTRDGGMTLTLADERADTGFFNVAFDKALQSVGEMRYATAHGYQSQVFEGQQMALYPPQKQVEWLRPFTAVAAVALGDRKFGRCITQALEPEQAGRYSVSERWAFEWNWLTPKGDVPSGGLIAASGDVVLGEAWCFLHTDGLYLSDDGGQRLVRVLDAAGKSVK